MTLRCLMALAILALVAPSFAASALRRAQDDPAAVKQGVTDWCRLKFTIFVAPRAEQPVTGEIEGSLSLNPLYGEKMSQSGYGAAEIEDRTWKPEEIFRSEEIVLEHCYDGYKEVVSATMTGLDLSFHGFDAPLIAFTRVEVTKVAPKKEKTLHIDAREHGNSSFLVGGGSSSIEVPLAE